MTIRTVLQLTVLSALTLCGGCASVKPWEMATFGSYIMRGDRDPIDDTFSEHVYFTREASSGGRGVGGGGCGCN
ncbi:MAG: DUF4266 domain-containing protein [Verrucomicrobia bacterium]|jgi:hypothetical protein|nr:DUF4266 domain-containing protein [Verrucomicrobiota bacterium]